MKKENVAHDIVEINEEDQAAIKGGFDFFADDAPGIPELSDMELIGPSPGGIGIDELGLSVLSFGDYGFAARPVRHIR